MKDGRHPSVHRPTTYVALLRGINVGGKAAVDMGTLRKALVGLGLDGVRTYINSGNVVFSSATGTREELREAVEAAIVGSFGIEVPGLLRTAGELAVIADSVPAAWVNDGSMRTDVFFLWPDVDRPSVLAEVPHKPAIEDLRYVPGAFVRRIDRVNVTKSPLTRIAGSDLYRRVTVRNINTVRKLRDLAMS